MIILDLMNIQIKLTKYIQKNVFRKYDLENIFTENAINERRFSFPNLKLYHHTYLLSYINYWKPTTEVNFLFLK